MRAFVAVDLIRPGEEAGRAPPHLTLLFLGEVEATGTESLVRRLAPVGSNHRPFDCRVDGLGAFPSRSHPRVVYREISAGRAELVALAADVRAALHGEFVPDRETFVPHLTLFRVRSSSDRTAAEELLSGARAPPPPLSARVTEFLLKQSTLGPGGAVHRVLHRFPLDAPAAVRP